MDPRHSLARTYHDAKENLKNGFYSFGTLKRDELESENSEEAHPLIQIIGEYREIKRGYASQLTLNQKSERRMPQEKLYEFKSILDSLNDIIQDAITNLSSEELLSIKNEEGIRFSKYDWSHSLISGLGEIGAVDLFNLLLEKIGHGLSIKDYVVTFKDLKQSYEGTALSEDLNLASSFLKRGDTCFVDMARSVLQQLMTENKLKLFFQKILKHDFKYTDTHKMTINECLASHQKDFLQDWTREKYINECVSFANSEYGEPDRDSSVYEEQFDRFVTKHKYQDIFAQLFRDYLIPYLIKYGEYQFNQPTVGARSLFCQATQALFEQNKKDDNCVVYDSLSQDLLLFKREKNSASLNKIPFSEIQGNELVEEIRSMEFTLSR